MCLHPFRVPACIAGLVICVGSVMPVRANVIVAGPGDAGLREAIQNAQTGDTVLVTEALALDRTIRIDKRLTVGSAHPHLDQLQISGSFDGVMFETAADGITFEKLIFRGSPQTDGLRAEKDLNLRDCLIVQTRIPFVEGEKPAGDRYDTAARLERVSVSDNLNSFTVAHLSAKDCRFSFNDSGGASAFHGNVEGCVFENNQGNGLSLFSGTVRNCVFASNSGYGMHFDPDPGILSLSGCLFYANGSGLLVREQGWANVDNCTFTRHTGGPAIVVREGGALFRHCTVADNLFFDEGVFSAKSSFSSTFGVELQNCIVANNPTANDPDASGLEGPWIDGGGNVIGGDPKLGPLRDNGGRTMTLMPLAGSPALDVARKILSRPPSGGLLADARGLSRLAGAAPDAGAVEANAAPIADTDGDGMPDVWELAHGLDPADPADAASDSDNDGYTASAEFTSRTNPMDANSVFRVDEFYSGDYGSLAWDYVPDRFYKVESSTDLVQWRAAPGFYYPGGDQRVKFQLDSGWPPPAPGPFFFRVIAGDNVLE